MNSRALRLVLVGLGAVVLLGAGAVSIATRHKKPSPAEVTELRAPAGVRIRVQVLNSTKTRGLARRATMLLRDRGFDVVETGTTSATRDTTMVLDLSGHAEWAQLISKVLGVARVEQRPDSSRYLDITVVLGSTWRPPAEPFYP